MTDHDRNGLDLAIDALYESGWYALDSSDCQRQDDGRLFPSPERIQNDFTEDGCEFAVEYIQLFDCYRAEWTDPNGSPEGAVVGASELEAAIYALAQHRQLSNIGVNP